MTLPRRIALASAALLAAPALRAQPTWPERPIRWIVNFPPGGAADTLSRILVERIGTRLGQPVVVPPALITSVYKPPWARIRAGCSGWSRSPR